MPQWLLYLILIAATFGPAFRSMWKLRHQRMHTQEEMAELLKKREEFNKRWREMSSEEKRRLQQAYRTVTGL